MKKLSLDQTIELCVEIQRVLNTYQKAYFSVILYVTCKRLYSKVLTIIGRNFMTGEIKWLFEDNKELLDKHFEPEAHEFISNFISKFK